MAWSDAFAGDALKLSLDEVADPSAHRSLAGPAEGAHSDMRVILHDEGCGYA